MMNDLSGLLNIHKPAGVTSFWVVKQVRRILNVRKAGHCGTLDPFATGVLLVLFGKATRLQSSFMSCGKVYRALVRLGVKTDTGDLTGEVRERRGVPSLPAEDVRPVLERFTGTILQVPPMYSALKCGGRRLYELARKGIEVERQPREVTVHSLDLLSMTPETLELRVACSKGTYIRTLAEDIGEALGCGAAVEALCRESVGEFAVADALDGARLQETGRDGLVAAHMPLERLSLQVGPVDRNAGVERGQE